MPASSSLPWRSLWCGPPPGRSSAIPTPGNSSSINTGTTIITFLMVFLIQNTQNRDTTAIQLKLDELIRANENAHNAMLCLEDLTEDEMKRVKTAFASLASTPGDATDAVHEVKEQLEDTEEVLEEATSKLAAAGRRRSE
jgi:hypothetical protein